MSWISTPSATRKAVLVALSAACLALPASGSLALDCGMPLAVQGCQDTTDAEGCGLLYLRIANIAEDGPVLHGLSLAPMSTVPGRSAGDAAAPAQCSSADRPLPPADPGDPERDCIAYLLPACTYGIEAEFGDGSHASADALQVQGFASGGTCTTVTVDMQRRAVTAAASDCDSTSPSAGMAWLENAETPESQAADSLGSLAVDRSGGDVTAITPILASTREP